MKIVNVNIDGLLRENEILTANYIKQNKFDVLDLQEVIFSKTNDIQCGQHIFPTLPFMHQSFVSPAPVGPGIPGTKRGLSAGI